MVTVKVYPYHLGIVLNTTLVAMISLIIASSLFIFGFLGGMGGKCFMHPSAVCGVYPPVRWTALPPDLPSNTPPRRCVPDTSHF
jgi:hypothetical protein